MNQTELEKATSPVCYWLCGDERRPFHKLVLQWKGRKEQWPRRMVSGRRPTSEASILDDVRGVFLTTPAQWVTLVGIRSVMGAAYRTLIGFRRYPNGTIEGPVVYEENFEPKPHRAAMPSTTDHERKLAHPMPHPRKLTPAEEAEGERVKAKLEESMAKADARAKAKREATLAALSPREREFLDKLAALCKEYNAGLGGCGCCGSPSVSVDGGKELFELSVTPDGRWDLG